MHPQRSHNKKLLAGWAAVSVSIVITCFWAFWGIVENFHEGWYFDSVLSNLGLMFVQYLSPMIAFLAVTLVSIFRQRTGGGLHILLALAGVWFFRAFSNAATFLIILPLAGLGLLYWFGRIQPRKTAVSLAIGLPILTVIIAGTGPMMRVSQRVDDGNLQARSIAGNGVELTWAPKGPGWPDSGSDWFEASLACAYLSEDGSILEKMPPQIWRLPGVEELVRSMSLHGKNSGGIWDESAGKASYTIKPDKDSPLWNMYSQVIYWWTATEVDAEKAYIIVYDGQVLPRSKTFGPAYLGFRCVK